MAITLSEFLPSFEEQLNECLKHREFYTEEDVRVTLVGTLLKCGARLPSLWPEYPLVYNRDRRIDLVVDTSDWKDSLAFEIKYEREKITPYQASSATAARITKDIMRLGAVHAHQKRVCLFLMLMDDPAFTALTNAGSTVSKLLALPKGESMYFDWKTLCPDAIKSYIKSLDTDWNPCSIERLIDTRIGTRHHLATYRVTHVPDTVYQYDG